MPRSLFEQVPENPFIDLAGHCWGEIEELDAAPSGARRPRNLAAGLHAHSRLAQFKAQAQLLLWANRSHHLHSDAFVIDVANNAAVRLVDRDVGQGSKFVPMASPSLSCRRYSCVHTPTESLASQNLSSILSPAGSVFLVTTMVRNHGSEPRFVGTSLVRA